MKIRPANGNNNGKAMCVGLPDWMLDKMDLKKGDHVEFAPIHKRDGEINMEKAEFIVILRNDKDLERRPERRFGYATRASMDLQERMEAEGASKEEIIAADKKLEKEISKKIREG